MCLTFAPNVILQEITYYNMLSLDPTMQYNIASSLLFPLVSSRATSAGSKSKSASKSVWAFALRLYHWIPEGLTYSRYRIGQIE